MGQAESLATMEREAQKHWADPYPLAFDDRPFKITDQHSVFVRHSVVFGAGESMSLGTGFYRYPGIQYLSIFFRPGEGNASVYKFAGLVMTHYTDKILIDGDVKLVFGVASTIMMPQDDKGFKQLQVICPFYFDSRS